MKNTKNKKNNLDPIVEAGKRKKANIYSDEADIRLKLAIEIYNARESKKLSQQKLAKMAYTTQKIISNIENGDVNIGIDLLNRLSKSLEFTSGTLGRIFNTPVPYYFIQEAGTFKIKIEKQTGSDVFIKI
ncbi:MAG: helix-turn-helix transcriptional regulator [Candidatus Paceibacterota bacterium]|jgi:ribosome-binding protein aMBF1 (putative translation factor)